MLITTWWFWHCTSVHLFDFLLFTLHEIHRNKLKNILFVCKVSYIVCLTSTNMHELSKVEAGHLQGLPICVEHISALKSCSWGEKQLPFCCCCICWEVERCEHLKQKDRQDYTLTEDHQIKFLYVFNTSMYWGTVSAGDNTVVLFLERRKPKWFIQKSGQNFTVTEGHQIPWTFYMC